MSTGAPSAMHMKQTILPGFPQRANLLPSLCAEIGQYTKKGAQDGTDRGLRDEALLWVTLMRDRRLMGRCFPEEAEPPPRSE
jgi:hypothetical protein